jgi:hypothetical protein
MAGLGGFSSSAHAYTGYSYFCPTNTTGTFQYKLVNGNRRCVSALFRGVTGVQFYTKNGPGVYHCAGAKTNSDGSGSNAIPFVCTSERLAWTGFYQCRAGYATGLNESSSPHYFYGVANWDTACSV